MFLLQYYLGEFDDVSEHFPFVISSDLCIRDLQLLTEIRCQLNAEYESPKACKEKLMSIFSTRDYTLRWHFYMAIGALATTKATAKRTALNKI